MADYSSRSNVISECLLGGESSLAGQETCIWILRVDQPCSNGGNGEGTRVPCWGQPWPDNQEEEKIKAYSPKELNSVTTWRSKNRRLSPKAFTKKHKPYSDFTWKDSWQTEFSFRQHLSSLSIVCESLSQQHLKLGHSIYSWKELSED